MTNKLTNLPLSEEIKRKAAGSKYKSWKCKCGCGYNKPFCGRPYDGKVVNWYKNDRREVE